MPYKKNGVWHTTKAEKAQRLEFCEVDGNEVRTMTFKGTGVCSETCRKKRAGEA